MKAQLIRHSEKLFYFNEIANNTSLHAASRALGISAPSLSHAVKELEKVLDVKLFLRSPKGLKLTEEGERLYLFCQKFFREMETLEENLSSKKYDRILPIRVGTFESIALYFWPLIYDILKVNSKITVNLTTNRSRQIQEQLISKNIDVAITVESIKHPDINKQVLYKDEYAFFCHKSLKINKISKDDLKTYNLYYFPDAEDSEGRKLKQYIRSYKLKFKEEGEIDSFEVISSFVNKNYGFGILPLKSVGRFYQNLKLLKVSDLPLKFGEHTFYLSYRKDLDLKQNTLNVLISAAQQAIQSIEN